MTGKQLLKTLSKESHDVKALDVFYRDADGNLIEIDHSYLDIENNRIVLSPAPAITAALN